MSANKLADFFAAVAPFLEGKATHPEAVAALWGSDPIPNRDAERLAIYGRFCRIHRFEAVDAVYASTRAEVIRLRSNHLWSELVESYFQKHPMHHVEINENGDELAPFIAGCAARFQLPSWMEELAELEWWEWRTLIAPNDPRDLPADQGALRIASTVELRQFQHDLCSWLDADPAERESAPEAESSIVLFWRNPELKLQRANSTPEELHLLKLVHEGAWSENAPIAAVLGPVLADLQEAGIILGNKI